MMDPSAAKKTEKSPNEVVVVFLEIEKKVNDI